jgi:DNA-binding response OmpR family regulator
MDIDRKTLPRTARQTMRTRTKSLEITMKIAVLDDDLSTLDFVCHHLTKAGHVCQKFFESRALIDELSRQTFDLFVLDWMLPCMTGKDVLGWIRANLPPTLPVLFLTSRGSDQDVVSILDAGADDYLVKPVSAALLLARTQAVLRRSFKVSEPSVRELFGEYEFDIGRERLLYKGTPISITPKEFALALLLFRHVGTPISTERILEVVWRSQLDAQLRYRTISTHISMIRTKLSLRSQNGYRLVPLYGYGYRLEQQAS